MRARLPRLTPDGWVFLGAAVLFGFAGLKLDGHGLLAVPVSLVLALLGIDLVAGEALVRSAARRTRADGRRPSVRSALPFGLFLHVREGERAHVLRTVDTAEARQPDDVDQVLRPYVPGDPRRWIHWRTSARSPHLMVLAPVVRGQAPRRVAEPVSSREAPGHEVRAAEALLVVLALALLATLGGEWTWIAGGTALLCAAGLRGPRPEPGPTAQALTLAGAALVVAASVAGVLAPLESAQVVLLGLLLLRATTAPSPRDGRMVVLLTLIGLLYASLFGWWSTPLVALAMFTALTVPWALVVFTRWEGGERPEPIAGGLALATVVTAAVLYLVLPRATFQWTVPGFLATPGFDDQVVLGDVGVVRNSGRVMLEVRPAGGVPGPPPRLRGAVLDRFDGTSWVPRRPPRLPSLPVVSGDGATEVWVRALPERRVFLPAATRAASLSTGEPLEVLGGGYLYPGMPREVRYRYVEGGGPRHDDRADRYLRIPASVDPRVGQLARRVGVGQDARARASSLLAWFGVSGFTYRLTSRRLFGRPDLSDFLFSERGGTCEYFASALAVLLRESGVPAVLVVGWYGGDWSPARGAWDVRQSHAHAWVDAYLDAEGWVPLDATPPGALPPPPGIVQRAVDRVLGAAGEMFLTLDDEGRAVARAALARHGPALVGGSAVLLVIGLAVAWWRRRPMGQVAYIHLTARRVAARRGWRVPTALPPVEAARWLVGQAGDGARPLEDLAWFAYRVRFGGHDDDALVEQAKDRLARLRAELPRTTPGRRGSTRGPARGAGRPWALRWPGRRD